MKDFSSEIFYRTARSSGSGGQNVNKVETMVEACWMVGDSQFLSAEEKKLVFGKLKNRINKDGALTVKCSETRSQLENKQLALRKMEELVVKSLVVPKKRKATKPTKEAKEKRLENKKKESAKKELRKPPAIT